MDEPMRFDARLEVSVSFGRFENDALSWEKWSSFSPNKYLEEAGNLSTPGSVAQKKAYFEAHYKKIAARKAEELEQEKLMNNVTLSPAASSKEDSVTNSSELDGSNGLSHGEQLIEEVARESCMALSANGSVLDEAEDNDVGSHERYVPETCMNGLTPAITLEEVKEDVAVAAAAVEWESTAIVETKDESSNNAEGTQLSVRDYTPFAKSAISQKQSQNTMEKSSERKNRMQKSVASKRGNAKLNSRNIAPKVAPTKKERTSTGAKNWMVSPPIKTLQTSNPRYPKPSSMSTPTSAPKTLRKQMNGSPVPKDKNPPMGQSKRSVPTALHMSLSMNSSNSLGTVSMTRKSLIMEQMGDKDIVKRAFKAFQNRANGSVTDERSKAANISSPAFAPKVSAHTPTKGNEGSQKVSLNRANQRSQSGTRSSPLLKGLNKSCVIDKRTTLAFSPTTGLSSDEKTEKRKEFLKNLEAKSIARGVEKAQLGAKSKEHVANQNHARPTLSR